MGTCFFKKDNKKPVALSKGTGAQQPIGKLFLTTAAFDEDDFTCAFFP